MCKHVLTFGIAWLGLGLPSAPGAGEYQGPSRPSDQISSKQTAQRRNSFRMSTAVVCQSIDGYETYKKLAGAELTSDEKLLIYYRPLGFKTAPVDGGYQAHFVQDGQIRKRGEKAIIRQKLKLLDCTAKDELPPQNLFLRNTVSLKGLTPGEYDFTIILHDEIAKGPPVTQVVRFRIVTADVAGATPQDESKGDDSKGMKKGKGDQSSRGERAPKDADNE